MTDQEPIRENVDSWQNLMFLYKSAMKEVKTKLDILNDEFLNTHQYNPIEYIKARLKSPESIVNKLKRLDKDTTMQNMVEYVHDIAGVRLVCSFTSDIYRLADMILKQKQFTILQTKDYIKNPKPSGYRSFHIILSVPISTTTEEVPTKVEVQIRTMAMDFWASLEHKIFYKFEGNAPAYISQNLQECARIVSELDDRMLNLNEAIMEAKHHQEEDTQ